MKVAFFDWNKAPNSTGLPPSAGVIKEVEIFTATDVCKPVLYLSNLDEYKDSAHNFKYEYAYIDTFKRYYFITDKIFSEGRWIISLEVDVMGTYRERIKKLTGFITRCRTSDMTIPDDLPSTGTVTQVVGGAVTINYSGISYIIGVAGRGGLGNTQYFAVNASTMDDLANYIWNTDTTSTNVNRGDYIVSCMPVLSGYLSNNKNLTNDNIYIGNQSTTFTGLKYSSIADMIVDIVPWSALSIPQHPFASELFKGKTMNGVEVNDADENAYWLNDKPYASYSLDGGLFGVINIDNTLLHSQSAIYVRVRADLTTGVWTLELSLDATGTKIFSSSTCQVYTPIPVTADTSDNSVKVGKTLISYLNSLTKGANEGTNAGGLTLGSDDGLALPGEHGNPIDFNNYIFSKQPISIVPYVKEDNGIMFGMMRGDALEQAVKGITGASQPDYKYQSVLESGLTTFVDKAKDAFAEANRGAVVQLKDVFRDTRDYMTDAEQNVYGFLNKVDETTGLQNLENTMGATAEVLDQVYKILGSASYFDLIKGIVNHGFNLFGVRVGGVPTYETISAGSAGAFTVQFFPSIRLIGSFCGVTDVPVNLIGRAYNRWGTFGDFSGVISSSNTPVPFGRTSFEREQLNNYINGVWYLE